MALAFLIPIDSLSIIFAVISREFLKLLTYLTFCLVFYSSLFIGIKRITGKTPPFSRFVAGLIIASFIWMYASSLSFEIDISSTLPATGLIIAYFFDRVWIKFKFFTPLIVISVCLIVFTSTFQKLQTPYYWWGWFEYGHTESVETRIPAFKGFKLSSNNAEIYERLYSDIMENTKPDDKIFTYPHIVSLNYITGRLQPTFAAVHYFDVTPDSIAIADARRLQQNPPKMMIVLQFPEDAYDFHEINFRSGGKSGQREIDKVINDLIYIQKYKIIDTFKTPGNAWPIIVYLREDK